MQNLRLLPEEKPYIKLKNINREIDGNSFSALEKDAVKNYHGKIMRSLNYLKNVNFKSENW